MFADLCTAVRAQIYRNASWMKMVACAYATTHNAQAYIHTHIKMKFTGYADYTRTHRRHTHEQKFAYHIRTAAGTPLRMSAAGSVGLNSKSSTVSQRQNRTPGTESRVRLEV